MQDDNELHAQSLLTVKAFTEWLQQFHYAGYNFRSIRPDVLNGWLNKYLIEHGFSADTKLIDGTYVEFLVIKE